MDTEVFPSFADVGRQTTRNVMYSVRAAYGRRLYDCIFDLKNAFQNTVADPEPDNPNKPHLFAEQAAGFVEFGIDEAGREIELMTRTLPFSHAETLRTHLHHSLTLSLSLSLSLPTTVRSTTVS